MTTTINKDYGHLAHDSEDSIRASLNARAIRSGVDLASDEDADRHKPHDYRTGATGLEPATSGVTAPSRSSIWL